MRIGFPSSPLIGAALVLLTSTFTAGGAFAATDADVIEALKAQIAALSSRLEALEQDKSAVRTETLRAPQVSEAAPRPQSWVDAIKVKGDFRFRHESFDIDNREDRNRQRIRARTEMTAQVQDDLIVGFGLATGSDDPVSTNQTLGSGNSSKDVALDIAYAKWASPVDGLNVLGGKFKNPFHRAGGNGLLWDSDLRPEGVGVTFERNNLFANGLVLSIDEDSNGEDAFLIGGQFGMNNTIGDGTLLTGVGYYNFTDTEGREPFFDEDDSFGNIVDPVDGTYVNGFELLEGFAEYAFVLNSSKITLFADYIKNLDASEFDTGWALGAKLKRAAWSFGWAYQDLEPDAVIGAFTDSDFIGGGTDGKGHILQAGYSLTKKIGLKGTLFINERNLDFGTEEDFKRLMLDISFKY